MTMKSGGLNEEEKSIMRTLDDSNLLIIPANDSRAQKSRLKRMVSKGGGVNLRWLQKNKSKVNTEFSPDIFTLMVELRWRWVLCLFFVTFVLSWFIFSLFWWAIAYGHGDLSLSKGDYTNHTPCVSEVHDLISCFMFSLETQYTTGYGTRSPTTECPEAVFLLSFQSIFGMFLQTILTGVIFAKLTRPKCRTQTVLFSRNAVISQRNKYLTLMFRVGDLSSQTSKIIGAKIRAWLLTDEVTPEGEILTKNWKALNLNDENGGSNIFLTWPLIITHRIDENSPLYEYSAMDLLNSKVEIMINLNGTVETTGQNTEARTSYLSTEILWGHRFAPVLKKQNNSSYGYFADLDHFHDTYVIDTPLCSAKQLQKMKELV